MGFNKEHSIKALKEKKNNVNEALEYMLSNPMPEPKIDFNLLKPSKKFIGKWSCPACTYDNTGVEKCEMCDTKIPNELYDKHKIKSTKLSLNEVNTKITKDEESNLVLDGNKISLVYFASEEKDDYENEDSWKAREFLELSTAIKVPDINTFLITYKIFQYFLSKPDIIMHYNNNELILNDILRFFGGIYYIPDKSAEERKELFEKIKFN